MGKRIIIILSVLIIAILILLVNKDVDLTKQETIKPFTFDAKKAKFDCRWWTGQIKQDIKRSRVGHEILKQPYDFSNKFISTLQNEMKEAGAQCADNKHEEILFNQTVDLYNEYMKLDVKVQI